MILVERHHHRRFWVLVPLRLARGRDGRVVPRPSRRSPVSHLWGLALVIITRDPDDAASRGESKGLVFDESFEIAVVEMWLRTATGTRRYEQGHQGDVPHNVPTSRHLRELQRSVEW